MEILTKTKLLTQFISGFSDVRSVLSKWEQIGSNLPIELQTQANASIQDKAFHCLGGSIYAFYPGVQREPILQAIVALQTISDYLDNLVDRMQVNDEQAFSQLHLSFLDALDPMREPADYYCYYPYQETIYLPSLVTTCRSAISSMPNYAHYKPYVLQLADNYCRLQVLKHLVPEGEAKLKMWVQQENDYPELAWNEWAAASGSTLGIFMCFAASYHDYAKPVRSQLFQAYFPYIQAVHILLDYYIDRREDREHSDLNFTFFYPNIIIAAERLATLYSIAQNKTKALPHPAFHELMLQGLIALYGSDPKLKQDRIDEPYRKIFQDRQSKLMYHACQLLRQTKHLR